MKGIVIVTILLISINGSYQLPNPFSTGTFVLQRPQPISQFTPNQWNTQNNHKKTFIVKSFGNDRMQTMFKKLKDEIIVKVNTKTKVINFVGLCNNCPIHFNNKLIRCKYKWCGSLSQIENYLANLLKEDNLKFINDPNYKAHKITGQWVKLSPKIPQLIDLGYNQWNRPPTFVQEIPHWVKPQAENTGKTTVPMDYAVISFSNREINQLFKKLYKKVTINIDKSGLVHIVGLCNNCIGSIYRKSPYRCTKMMCPNGSSRIESHLIKLLNASGFKWHPTVGLRKDLIYVGTKYGDRVALAKVFNR